MDRIKLAILLFIPILLASCNSKSVYEQNHDFVDAKWNKYDAVTFEVNITDTLSVYNIYINNRITGQYTYSNLYLFVDTQMPNNQTRRDTLECMLLDPSGKPLGKGFGSVWSSRIPYMKFIKFPQSGTYTFTLHQAMRVDDLEHILDAGVSIEKAKL